MITYSDFDLWLDSMSEDRFDAIVDEFFAWSASVPAATPYREGLAGDEIDGASFVYAVLSLVLPEGSTEPLWF